MNIKIPALLRRLTGALARRPKTYPCLLTEDDVSELLSLADRIAIVRDEVRLQLPSGIVITATEARRWIAANTERCTCPECEAGEFLSEAAAEMGLTLFHRRLEHESVTDATVAEETLFGYMMARMVIESGDDGELAWAQRLVAEAHASADAGDTDGKD